MHIFYTPYLKNSQDLFLSEDESKHCIRVLRLQTGDQISLVDGSGGFYQAEITDANPKKVHFEIVDSQQEFGKRNHYLHIAIAPTKNIERVEWFLEKATEIGIDEITPIICERSERKEVKFERLEKVITSAVKQSIKAYHPKLNSAIRLKELVESKSEGQRFIAHCLPETRQSLKDSLRVGEKYLVLIGPEGDFSNQEIDKALSASFIPISLGESRLRAETAALQACFEINYLNR
ncbi:MAG: rRNA ((1498)-N(3))-methyltransferase [Sphingobacteriaceae bacterium]|jgi:16S rRNA (uracil1498-N3)-methyltransferase|nr:rRNA ((1498)-N(3))-methyltransferase [Sphingobacteriaceae bacterium]